MSLQTHKSRLPSPLAQVIKHYRDTFALTQEQLACDLNVDVRTLRRWENGETVLNDVRELRRIATLLGVEPERLGVTPSTYSTLTPEQLDSTIEHIWNLIEKARGYEANTLIDAFIKDINVQIDSEDPALLHRLAHTLHLAGYIKSMITRSNESTRALNYYAEMEQVAHLLQNDTLLNIALTYEGDMYARMGNVQKGIQYLEAARDTTPQADPSARGNGIQLLGRAYLRAQRIEDFERAMDEAEELANCIQPEKSSTRGQYSVGTVYEEYARSYSYLGQPQRAMDYLDKAEQSLATTKHWEILIKTARAMTLIHSREIKSGLALAIESFQLCRAHGTIRLMERIYSIQNYLDRMNRELGQAGTTLRETIDGPIEYPI
jgi:transcriptional regulator with XRE-family HTH domain